MLVSQIPQEVKTVIDVGCGGGQNARKIKDTGRTVDGVSPSPMLARQTRELLGKNSEVFECYFEDLQTDKKYDLVLFSESFQYMELELAMKKTVELLNPGGYLLISDIFKRDNVEGKCPLSGGHRWSAFSDTLAKFPFTPVEDNDITEQIAPTIDIENNMFMQVGLPVFNLVDEVFTQRHPLLVKLVKWKYKKKLASIHAKYFAGDRTGKMFKKFKTYRQLLYKKSNTDFVGEHPTFK